MKKIVIPFLLLVNSTFGQAPDFTYTNKCFGDQTIFAASSSLPDTAIQMWQWDLNNDGIYELTGDSIVHFFTTAGTFPVKLKITPHFGSADSITHNVVISPLPNVNFIVDNLCTGSVATYYSISTISSGNITQWKWDFDNNGNVDNTSNDTVTFSVGGTPTSYFSRLTCVSDSGCSSFATKSITVFQTPTAAFSIADTCLNNNTMFTNYSTITSPDYFRWNFGDGTQTTTSGNASHTYASPGYYNVFLIAVTLNGCRDTSNSIVATINSLPVVTIDTSSVTSFFEGGSVVLTAQGANSYLWNTSATTQSITVMQSGSYSVMGTDAKGCSSSAYIKVTKETIPDTVAVSSSILTPNGDGINDYFTIENKEAYQSCLLKVYNMWNVLVFSKERYNNDWAGTYNDKPLPDGAYYYIVTCDDKPMIKGNINILLK